TVSVEWIDLLKKTYQGEIGNIKKASAFNQRINFDVLNELIFTLEKEILKALISWVKSGFSLKDIVGQIAQLKNQLISIEQFIVSAVKLPSPILNTRKLSVTDLSSRIYSILVNKVFRTFPEKYRWMDD
ncbi:hypothetical protein K8R62_03660, partial [bacterium]|nr:hypothetical protein [bacterium]